MGAAERRAAAMEMRAAGESIREIARKMGVTERTVQRWLPAEMKHPQSPRITEEERKLILLLSAEECPRKEIARTLGRSPRAVSRVAPATLGRGGRFDLIARLERIPNTLTHHQRSA